jgi:hypothetical protein
MNTNNSKSISDLISEILESLKKLLLFIVLIASIFVALTMTICVGVNFFYKKANSIEIKESGAMVIRLNNVSIAVSVLTMSRVARNNGGAARQELDE